MTPVISTAAGRWMRAELAEQPERVSAALDAVREQGPALARVVAAARQVILLGRGSSRSASTYGAQAFRAFAGVPAYSVSPAHLAWGQGESHLSGTLAIAVSQSGESTEILAAARRVLEQGGEVIVITNAPDSTLAGMVPAERLVAFNAGSEIAVPATKSFTTSMACLLGVAAAARPEVLAEAAARLPGLMAQVLTAEPVDIRSAANIVCAGEGFAEAVGEEGAIKFRETLRLPVASFETSEFLHGSINSVDASTAVVVVCADSNGEHLAEQAVRGAAERGAHTISVGPAEASRAEQHVRIPPSAPHLAAFLAVIPLQVAAHDAALARGHNPDVPDGLRKVTIIEEMVTS